MVSDPFFVSSCDFYYSASCLAAAACWFLYQPIEFKHIRLWDFKGNCLVAQVSLIALPDRSCTEVLLNINVFTVYNSRFLHVTCGILQQTSENIRSLDLELTACTSFFWSHAEMPSWSYSTDIIMVSPSLFSISHSMVSMWLDLIGALSREFWICMSLCTQVCVCVCARVTKNAETCL